MSASGPGAKRPWSALLVVSLSSCVVDRERTDAPTPARVACPDADAQLRSIWNPARRDAIVAQLHALGGYHGPDAAQVVPRMVDDFAREWLDDQRQTCGFAREGVHVDERLAYLENARFELDATLGLLDRPDYALAIEARPAIAGLPRPARISLVAVATGDGEAAIDVRRALALAHVLVRVGRGADATAALESSIARAEEAGLHRLAAQGRLALAEALAQAGRDEAAEAAFAATITAAAATGDVRTEILGLLGMAGAAARRHDDAAVARCEARTNQLSLAASGDQALGIHESFASAVFALIRGDHEIAGRTFARTLYRAESCTDCDWRQLAALRNNAAVTYAMHGDHGSALMLLERAAALTREQAGAMHPSVALVLRNVAITQQALGRSAIETWREVRRIESAVSRVDVPDPPAAADATLLVVGATMAVDERASAAARGG